MTLSTLTSRNDYTGAGSTGPFAFTYKIFAAADLAVVKRTVATGVEHPLTYAVDYTVAGVGSPLGGTITLVAPLAVGETLAIRRIRPLVQATSIRNQGEFLPEIHEDTFDHFIMVDQQQQEALNRTLQHAVTVNPATVSAVLPAPVADRALVWSNDATKIDNRILDNAAIALPGGGRTVSSVTNYLGNNVYVNPKDFGASHASSASVNRSAINAAFDCAFGALGARNGTANANQNVVVFFRGGNYQIDDELNFQVVVGGHIMADMRMNVTITQSVANKRILNADAGAYLLVENITFVSTATQDIKHAMLEFDWSGTYPNTLKTQQITFRDCYFNGNGLAMVGVRIARHGGSAWDGVGVNDITVNPGHFNQGTQGDTIVFYNCLWDGFKVAGLSIGSREFSTAQNALAIMVHGGDFQHCTKNSIEVNGGQVLVDGTSFQNQQDLGGTVQGGYAQVMNAGADIMFYQASVSPCILRNIRSESMVLLSGVSAGAISAIVENCQTFAGNVISWNPANNVGRGQLFRGHWNPGDTGGWYSAAKQDGRCWIAWQGGTTGSSANEPNWAAQPLSIFAIKDGAMAQGSTTLVLPSQTYNAGAHNGKRVIVAKAGSADGTQALFATITGGAGSNFTLDAACATTGGVGQGGLGVEQGGAVLVPDAVRVWCGAGVADNTVIWLLFEFDAIWSSQPISNSQFELGRFQPGSNAQGVIQYHLDEVSFSRPDWLNYQINNGGIGNFGRIYQQGTAFNWPTPTRTRGVHVGVGAWSVPTALGTVFGLLPGSPGEYLSEEWDSFGGALLNKSGAGGIKFMDVGIDRVAAHDTDYRRNALGVVGRHLSGAIAYPSNRGGWPTGTDQAGADFLISAIPSTGSGTPGSLRLGTARAGSTGSSINAIIDGAVLDELGRMSTLFGTIKKAVVGVIDITAAGSAQPNPAGAEVYRYRLAGNATINAPLNAAEGETLTLELLNNTGGAVVVTDGGGVFLGTLPTPGAGKWRTRRYVYDATLSKWKATGADSGDL
jgi:hypothetical protein